MSDAELLCALAQSNEAALRELHCRYAPRLYTLAFQIQHPQPERGVQDACLLVARHADCHARTALEARLWILALAHQSLRATAQ
ncbi:hypothetical protein [Deinococcus sp. QL22]|uniref:hypothetical protein n=1 Tax=Deinococcus sp. QL22 TaxID=2939437 RepID=UPI0020173253|nr:hypothetical protein [Deinococcus sp. QL22]UQN10742.1 hypothetical protein M1R55_31400 [Deinococcus sp. QL22]